MLFLLQRNQILQYEWDYSEENQKEKSSENLLKEQKKAYDSVSATRIWKAEQILIEGIITFIDTDTEDISSSKDLRDLTKCCQVHRIHIVFGTSI